MSPGGPGVCLVFVKTQNLPESIPIQVVNEADDVMVQIFFPHPLYIFIMF